MTVFDIKNPYLRRAAVVITLIIAILLAVVDVVYSVIRDLCKSIIILVIGAYAGWKGEDKSE